MVIIHSQFFQDIIKSNQKNGIYIDVKGESNHYIFTHKGNNLKFLYKYFKDFEEEFDNKIILMY